MSSILKFGLGAIPLVFIGNNVYNSIYKPFEMKIKGCTRMVVSFKKSRGIELISIKHMHNGIEFNSNYSEEIGDLIIEKHTVCNRFVNDFPILSVGLSKNNDYHRFKYPEIQELIKQAGLKTHIVYSTPFSKNKEITLDWGTDAEFIVDYRF